MKGLAVFAATVSTISSGVACGGTTSLPDDTTPRRDTPDGSGNLVENGGSGSGFTMAPELDAAPRDSTCDNSQHAAELWRRRLGDDDVAGSTSIASDPAGNVFVAGALFGVIKFDHGGDALWSRPFGSFVAVGANERVYVAGTFDGSVDLDSCHAAGAGKTDVYLAELDMDGVVLGCLSLGGPGDEGISGLAVDRNGAPIVSGPGLGTVKLDARGHTLWKQPISGGIAVDSQNDVVVTGAFSGEMAIGSEVLESAGGDDVFVAKLDPHGNVSFARRFGDAGSRQIGQGIAVDEDDDVLVSGVFDGSVDFGGGPLTVHQEACPAETWCEQAGFIVKLTASGAHVWSRSRAPVRSLDGIAVDSRGNVIVSGAYPGNVPPYRLPLLVELDADGSDVERPFYVGNATTDAGAGHGVAFDSCDNLLWSFGAPPEPSATSRSFLAKLAP